MLLFGCRQNSVHLLTSYTPGPGVNLHRPETGTQTSTEEYHWNDLSAAAPDSLGGAELGIKDSRTEDDGSNETTNEEDDGCVSHS